MEIYLVFFDDRTGGVEGVFASYGDAWDYINDTCDGTLDDYDIEMWLVGTGVNS